MRKPSARISALAGVALAGALLQAVAPVSVLAAPSRPSPVDAARAGLARDGVLPPTVDASADLRARTSVDLGGGQRVVRFGQVAGGLPVLGADVAVTVERSGATLGEVAHTSARLGGAAPSPARLSETAARQAALAGSAHRGHDRGVGLIAAPASLWAYDPTLLGAPATRASTVWQVGVRSTSGPLVDDVVLVDAVRGDVVLRIDQVETARDRKVCDLHNVAQANESSKCTTYTRVEPAIGQSDAPSGDQQVDQAYDNTGATYDFYAEVLGRDSIDNAGMPLISAVDYCPTKTCSSASPYRNAYWANGQMTFGKGYAAADDVVGHELTHGVTERTARLYYYFQSGAINESMSDVFGELIDRWHVGAVGDDSAAAAWLIGEDLPGGAIRSMSRPRSYPGYQPSVMDDPYWSTSAADNRGVHTNSGVGNRAAYLVATGVSPSGSGRDALKARLAKTARLYYRALLSLGSASQYPDLAAALRTSCASLSAQAPPTVHPDWQLVPADCAAVDGAIAETKMGTTGGSLRTPAPHCSSGETAKQELLFNGLDTTAQRAAWAYSGGSSARWFHPANGYATSGSQALFGFDYSIGERTATLQQNVAVTGATGIQTYLRFRHAYDFEVDGSTAVTGGRIDYSTDSGSSWHDARLLLTAGGYDHDVRYRDGTLHRGFGANSGGWTAARLRLTSLAGKSVRIRFAMDASGSLGSPKGWFIDDVEAYTCAA